MSMSNNLEKIIMQTQNDMNTTLKFLKNYQMNPTQNQLYQKFQSQVTKKPLPSSNDKIEYPEAVKKAYNLLVRKQSKNEDAKKYQLIDLENIGLKGEENYYIKKKSKFVPNQNEIVISSESVSDHDMEVQQNNEYNLQSYNEIYRGISNRIQNNQASLRKRRKRKRFDQASLQKQMRQKHELEIEYEETKVEIPFEIPKEHTKDRQLDQVFPDFSIRFLNDLNKQTFGKSHGMFNKCAISAQPNFMYYSPLNAHQFNLQHEICNTSNNSKEENKQYLQFLKKCFELQGSSIFVTASYAIKQFQILTIKYQLHRYKHLYYFEKIDLNTFVSCPSSIDDPNTMEDFFRVLGIPYDKTKTSFELKLSIKHH